MVMAKSASMARTHADHWRTYREGLKGAPWNLTFIGEDGKVLTESAGKSLGRFKLGAESNVTAQPVGEFGVTMDGSARDESDVFIAIQLHLSVGEDVYRLGRTLRRLREEWSERRHLE